MSLDSFCTISSMPLNPARPARRIPQQERGQKRVTTLLDAAASVIADAGCEAATMAEIAERAGACIGSLYQFFPNKESITDALSERYCEASTTLWSSLEEEGASLSNGRLVRRLISEMLEFLDERPALLALLDGDMRPTKTSIRDLLRRRLARILRSSAPNVSHSRAFFLATVILQMMKGMNELYAEYPKTRRKWVSREYESALGCYLKAQLRSSTRSNQEIIL